MKISDILALDDNSKIVNLLTADETKYEDIDKYKDQFEGEHDILNRTPKYIGPEDNRIEVEQAKIVVTFQKKIVNFAVSFLFGAPVNLENNSSEKKFDKAFGLIKDTWKKAKLDSHNKKLARTLFKETQVAEYFEVVKDKDGNLKIRATIFSYENGDRIYPFFNEYGDMVAFTRTYQALNEEGKKIDYVDVYTAEQIITFAKGTKNTWEKTERVNGVILGEGETEEKVMIDKIPIVYYEQDETEWDDVQTQIDKFELRLSKLIDTNDYFSSPAVKIKGKLKEGTMPDKGEIAKLFQIEAEDIGGQTVYGDVGYITWDQTPASMELELKTLKGLIHSQTQTPDLSFDNVKGIPNISGIALKFMFLDSILKSLNKQEIFAEGFNRRINILKAIHSKMINLDEAKNFNDLDIGIKFGDVLPESLVEIVNTLYTASGAKPIMSQKSAVRQNPLVEKPDEVLDEIEEEQKKEDLITGSQVIE